MSVAFFDIKRIPLPGIELGRVWSFLKVAQDKIRLGGSKHYRLDPVRPEDREGLCHAYAAIADNLLDVSMPPGPSGYVHLTEDGQRLIYVEARQTAFLPEEEKPEVELSQLNSARYVNMSVDAFNKIITTKTSSGWTSRHLVDRTFNQKLGAQVSADDLKWIAPRILGTRRAQRALASLSLS